VTDFGVPVAGSEQKRLSTMSKIIPVYRDHSLSGGGGDPITTTTQGTIDSLHLFSPEPVGSNPEPLVWRMERSAARIVNWILQGGQNDFLCGSRQKNIQYASIQTSLNIPLLHTNAKSSCLSEFFENGTVFPNIELGSWKGILLSISPVLGSSGGGGSLVQTTPDALCLSLKVGILG